MTLPSCLVVAVEAGGYLDLRGLVLQRAPGREYDIPGLGYYFNTRLIMGGSVMVYPGGRFHAAG